MKLPTVLGIPISYAHNVVKLDGPKFLPLKYLQHRNNPRGRSLQTRKVLSV